MNSLVGNSPLLLDTAEGMERLFDLDLQLIVDSGLTIIALFFLYFALSYFLFNPARKMLKSRQEKIQGELESAAADMETASNLKEEYELKIKEIEKEADRILGEARQKALANESQIIAEAKEEAARIMERAHKEAELEKQKAADDVKKEMIALASMMAGKVVSASIDTTVQESLIDETLKEMGESTWLS